MKFFLLLLTSFMWFVGDAQTRIEKGNQNMNEFHRTVECFKSKICALPNYITDTSGSHWSSTDPTGYYSFEGWMDTSGIYIFKLKSYIYANDYWEKRPQIKCSYAVNDKKTDILELNCGSDSFDEDYPFSIDAISVAYLEKTYTLIPSEVTVFEKSFFEERYVVTFKDGTIKRYKVDPVNRDFRLVN